MTWVEESMTQVEGSMPWVEASRHEGRVLDTGGGVNDVSGRMYDTG